MLREARKKNQREVAVFFNIIKIAFKYKVNMLILLCKHIFTSYFVWVHLQSMISITPQAQEMLQKRTVFDVFRL